MLVIIFDDKVIRNYQESAVVTSGKLLFERSGGRARPPNTEAAVNYGEPVAFISALLSY